METSLATEILPALSYGRGFSSVLGTTRSSCSCAATACYATAASTRLSCQARSPAIQRRRQRRATCWTSHWEKTGRRLLHLVRSQTARQLCTGEIVRSTCSFFGQCRYQRMGSGDPFYPRIDYIFDSDEFSMVCCVDRRRRESQCSLLAAAALH